jgi:hypothetical protein
MNNMEGTETEAIAMDAESIAEDLIGSCNEPPERVILDTMLAEALDELALRCTCCGWWFTPDEVELDPNSEYRCEDCMGQE